SFFIYVCIIILLFVFFFFQAEDGIRDLTVTGVQTCALPICTCCVQSSVQSTAGDTATSRRPIGNGNRNAVRTRAISCQGDRCTRSEEHTSELQSQSNLVCRLLLEKKKTIVTHLDSLRRLAQH